MPSIKSFDEKLGLISELKGVLGGVLVLDGVKREDNE